jgi:hypothetical protein
MQFNPPPALIPKRDAALATFLAENPDVGSLDDYRHDDGRFQILVKARRAEIARRMQPYVRAFEQAEARQAAVVSLLALASPTMQLQRVLEEAAGSSRGRYDDFLGQLDRFEAVRNAFQWPKVFRETIFTSRDYREIPRFVYREESLHAVVARSWVWLALLALGTSLAAGGSVFAFHRMREI